ncbi:MAG: TetR/AcrR family transcriptional regulator [Sphingomonadales bacterium]|nr:TetR/AcrR family transcriptional regulator [Sphingomonadales bacterium]
METAVVPTREDAPPRREDARIVRSREALRAALLDLVERHPLDTITIRDITDAANVGYATFYRHFPTKAALLDDLAAAQIRRLIGLSMDTQQSGTIDSRASCRAIVSYVDQHRALWRALLTGGAAATIREEIIQISREVALEYRRPGSAIPDDLAFRFVASAMVETLAWWLEQGNLSVERGAELLDRLVISPVVRPVP